MFTLFLVLLLDKSTRTTVSPTFLLPNPEKLADSPLFIAALGYEEREGEEEEFDSKADEENESAVVVARFFVVVVVSSTESRLFPSVGSYSLRSLKRVSVECCTLGLYRRAAG